MGTLLKLPKTHVSEQVSPHHQCIMFVSNMVNAFLCLAYFAAFEAQLLKVVLDLRIQNEQLQQQMRETQVSVAQVLRHVVSLKHQEEQPRFGERATPQEMARPEPPELFLMPICDMEQFRAAEARLKNPADRTLLVFVSSFSQY